MDYGVLVATDLWSGVGCAADAGGRGIDYPLHHITDRAKRSCCSQFNLIPWQTSLLTQCRGIGASYIKGASKQGDEHLLILQDLKKVLDTL